MVSIEQLREQFKGLRPQLTDDQRLCNLMIRKVNERARLFQGTVDDAATCIDNGEIDQAYENIAVAHDLLDKLRKQIDWWEHKAGFDGLSETVQWANNKYDSIKYELDILLLILEDK